MRIWPASLHLVITSLLGALMLSTATDAPAQPYCRVRTFTIADGLSGNSISDFAQTSDGMMWVATWNGLSCYDGYQFQTFRNGQGGMQVLTSNRLKFIRPSTTGDIWCSTFDGRAYIFDRSTFRYTDITALVKERLGIDFSVRNIYHLDNGAAWLLGMGPHAVRIDEKEVRQGKGMTLFSPDKSFGTKNARKVETDSKKREWFFTHDGLILYGTKLSWHIPFEWMCSAGGQTFFASRERDFGYFDEKTRRMHMISLPADITGITTLLRRDDRTVALGTNRGILCYDLRSKKLSQTGGSEASVKTMFVDSRKRIWAWTDKKGVTMIDGENNLTSLDSETPAAWYGTRCEKPLFHEDNNNTVWLIPESGVFSYYDDAKRRLIPYNLGAGESGNFPVYLISLHKKDDQGNLWFTSNHNLTLISFSDYQFHQTTVKQHEDTRSVLVCPDGTRLTGLLNGVVAVHDAERRLLGYMAPDGSVRTSLSSLSPKGIYSIYRDSKGRIWFGTKGDGAYMLTSQGKGTRMRHFLPDDSDRRSLSSANIYDIKEDGNGRLWLATYGGGLNLAEEAADGSIRFAHSGNGMSRTRGGDFDKARRLTMAGNTIIAATSGGIITFSADFGDASRIKFFHSTYRHGDPLSLSATDALQAFVSKHTGRMYVTTLGGSLEVMKGGSLLKDNLEFADIAGLDDKGGTVQSIAEDRDGMLWLIRENTINRYNQQTGQCDTYGPNDWDKSILFTEALPCVTADEITVGITGGFLSFNPARIHKSAYSPRIVFSGIMYQGEHDISPIVTDSELEIPPSRRNATIYFSALDYQDNRLIRYAYKIKELDKEWSYTGEHRTIQLNHIPSGHYTLIVKSTNSDGVWAENSTELKIHIKPVFWETCWAWMLYIAIALLAVYAAFRAYRSRQNALMEKRLNVQLMQFFKDISQQLRTPLALIGEPVNQVLADEQLSTTARTYLEFVERNARKMLELVNKGLDMDRLHKTSEEVSADSNKAFAERALAYVEEHLADGDMKITDMAQALGMSRTVFYGKVKAVFGMSPIDFIRRTRMEKAKKMVVETRLSFSEIAYSVGFSDPKYFGKCFKGETGLTLSEYRNKHQKD